MTKQSKEKMDILRAVGAQVVVCPTDVEPTDPRSYYSVSKKLAQDTPNSWYANQYDNPSNALANYQQTGPEIWEQTDGKITHFVVGVGTGGDYLRSWQIFERERIRTSKFGESILMDLFLRSTMRPVFLMKTKSTLI